MGYLLPTLALPLILGSLAALADTGARPLPPNCLGSYAAQAPKDIKQAMKQVAVARVPVGNLDEAKKLVSEALKKKGLSEKEAEYFLERLFHPSWPVEDPAAAVALVNALDPARLKSEYAAKVMPYAIRNAVNFHGPGMDAPHIAQLLNTWSDEELGPLARMFFEANALRKQNPSLTPPAALRASLEKQGMPADTATRILGCAGFRRV